MKNAFDEIISRLTAMERINELKDRPVERRVGGSVG